MPLPRLWRSETYVPELHAGFSLWKSSTLLSNTELVPAFGTKLRCVQAQDEELKAIIDVLAEKATHNNYFMKAGLLHKMVDDNELIVVLAALQRDIIKQAHERGHFSTKKTKDVIAEEFYIPKLEDKVQRQIRCCIPCIVTNRILGKK
ncbi:uncharacterized protein LOC115628208 [Scaptodrosophila lebanonensis]|uniref:Uncharacterized protein LOC115628208 n=1 Tax=Drosophila lebanonensis TaxID=7225 RepID=A0A6J2TY44_DROLE|nr:uncharacterized protein LOC115628208 [Scaptodrosophila lebanonensis]